MQCELASFDTNLVRRKVNASLKLIILMRNSTARKNWSTISLQVKLEQSV